MSYFDDMEDLRMGVSISFEKNQNVSKIKSLLRGRGIRTTEARGEVITRWRMEMGITRGYAATCTLICKTEASYKAFKEWFYNIYPINDEEA